MQPPAHASYHAPGGGDNVPVEIDRDQTERLDEAIASAPGHVGDLAAVVPVWFDWDSEGGDSRRVAVFIGSRRVGALDAASSESFSPVMRVADQRDAKPRAQASLERAKHRDPPYLLVVSLPAEGWSNQPLRPW
jgi:hypothetical protein